jgi:putative glutathione S-transferase
VRHYHFSHETINPNRIIPVNPDLDFMEPHGRDGLAIAAE